MTNSSSYDAPRIAVATGTRADWGLLSPLCAELRARGADVRVIASNMHYSQGTASEIEADGFDVDTAIRADGAPAEISAAVLRETASALERLRPRMLVVLGDRFEALASAMAATLCGVETAHIAGGAISEGAMDDSLRHAITKLAALHLAETDEYAARIVRMGEEPDRVLATGAIGLAKLTDAHVMSREALAESVGLDLTGRDMLLVTMHAATLDPVPATERLDALLDALEAEVPEAAVILTWPNNDVDPRPLISRLDAFAARRPGLRKVIPSLGSRRYASALRHCAAVVGNSSSGIVEAPSAGVPTLDIGIRQRGRTAGPSVTHCGPDTGDIRAGLRYVLSAPVRAAARVCVNPYYRPDTVGLMATAILRACSLTPRPKRFYEK